ncbi:MAG: tRNA glutamyl-Q(34) synthetase GluQRS [Alphaproteobacteria bacterium]
MPSAPVTRFAPSPTGPLHLGHAYAALMGAHLAAAVPGGRFLLRIEDLDQGRARPAFEAGILEDLSWLGLRWEEPVMRQSQRAAAYGEAVERLSAQGLVYPCFCTRKDILAEIERSASAPHGPDGPLYPGLCRDRGLDEIKARRRAGETPALRLDMAKAIKQAGRPIRFRELGAGPGGENGVINADPAQFGDIVLVRKDAPASYHLSVVVDDAAQGISLVTRGQDLFPATHVHRLLQILLGLPEPAYWHHGLVTDEEGRRLAKRDGARALATLRDQGVGPERIKADLKASMGSMPPMAWPPGPEPSPGRPQGERRRSIR